MVWKFEDFFSEENISLDLDFHLFNLDFLSIILLQQGNVYVLRSLFENISWFVSN